MTIEKMIELIKEAPALDGVEVQYLPKSRYFHLSCPTKDSGPEGMIGSGVLEAVELVVDLFGLKIHRFTGFGRDDAQAMCIYIEGEMDTAFLPILRVVEEYRNTYAPGCDLKYVNDGVLYNIAIFDIPKSMADDLDKREDELFKQLEPFGKKIAETLTEDCEDGTWFWSITLTV